MVSFDRYMVMQLRVIRRYAHAHRLDLDTAAMRFAIECAAKYRRHYG